MSSPTEIDAVAPPMIFKTRISIIVSLVVIVLVWKPGLDSATFDCAKATTKIEKQICADAKLSALDEKLNGVYRNVLAQSAIPQKTKNQQREWIKNFRDVCKDAVCLEQAYTSRISDLQKQLEAQSSKPVSDKPLLVLPFNPAGDQDAAAGTGAAILRKTLLQLTGRIKSDHDAAGAKYDIKSGKTSYTIRYVWDLTDEQKDTLNKIEAANQYVILKGQLVSYKGGSKTIDPDSEVQIFAQLP